MAITKVTNRVLDDSSVGVAQLSAGAVQQSFGNTSGAFSFRNKIINGAMEIDQRNNGSAVTSTSTYTVDRWLGATTGSAATFQRVAATAKYVSTALRITGSSGNTNASIQQRIESSTARSLVGLPVVVSFYAASPSITTLRLAIAHPNAVDNWSAATNINFIDITISPTMTRYSVPINALPSGAGNGLGVWFLCMSGLGTGQTLDITGVQLEEGSVATPFEQRPIGLELSLCQRYYQKLTDAVLFRANSSGNFAGGVMSRTLQQAMRLTPAANLTVQGGTYNDPQIGTSTDSFFIYFRTGSTPGDWCTYTVRLDAEL